MDREWQLVEQAPVSPALRQAVGGHPLVARLLAQRGFCDPERATKYLDAARYTPASPDEFPDMETTTRLVREAIASDRRIRIWGDFDADGQTATTVLYEALTALGAQVDYQLPRRREGHGFHRRAIDDALRDYVSLLITCDTGIGDIGVVAEGVRAGLTVIITDHHDTPSPLPPAHAIINPKMLPLGHPLHELAGVGVAYVVARALLDGETQAPLLEEMLDIVAVGLVADVAMQVQDVRYLVQRGLTVLHHTRRPGLRALIKAAGLDLRYVDEHDIGFQLGPRLNAAGRLANAEQVVRLLLTDEEEEAQGIAEALEALNRDRRAYTEAMLAQAEDILSRDRQALREPAIVLDGETWEPGILGLVAGHLARHYDRPVILIAHRKGQPSVASARSVENVDIHEAIVSQEKYLLRQGGHPMAAGFSIKRENVPAFREGLWRWLRRNAPLPEAAPPLLVDAELPGSQVGPELAREVLRLSPFGAGNPQPLFMLRGGALARVEDVSRRRETAHRRLYVDDRAGHRLDFTWFNAKTLPQVGEVVDAAFHIGINHWKGKERLQLELVDWRPATLAEDDEQVRLFAGQEIVDWRCEKDQEKLLSDLRALYGDGLLVWSEGSEEIEGAVTRADLMDRRCIALAVATPPPSPESLAWVLGQTAPQILYLLPPYPLPDTTPSELLQKVTGMLRVALRAHDGRIDVLQMAARIAARRETVMAALGSL